MSYDYSENILVQESAGNLLRDELGWDVRFAYNTEVLGKNGTFGRESYHEILLLRYFREALKKLNPWMNDNQISEAQKVLESRLSTSSLLQVNEEKYFLIRDGIPVTVKKTKGQTETKKVAVIDFQNLDNNYFLAVKELKIHSDLYRRRTDIVGFVNGIPLLFVELKKNTVDVQNAYDDNYTDYQDTIPHLFYYNAFLMLSNGTEAKVGTLGSKYEFFHEWKRLAEEDQGSVALETMLRGICKKENFLDLFENFILFDHSGGRTAKILARNHQYLGVNEAMKAYAARKLNDGKLGVFWHTQGSGKSYSMVFLAQKIRRKFEGSPTFVILTDREELNSQISDTFENCGLLGKNKSAQFIATSGEDLVQKLKGNPSFIFTLIQKFNKPNLEPIYPEHDIIIMSDEAHRSQYGIFADNMMKLLPTAARIGFTGTPLLSSDNITARTFGGYVSVYDFKRAVEDGATVPLYYENRGEKILDLHNPEITEKILDAIENADLDVDQQDKLEAEFAKEIHLMTAEPRLKSIARDFVNHFSDLWTSGKAMFVCLNKVTCVRMYNYVQVDVIVKTIARTTFLHAQELAELACEETRMGNVEDKIKKIYGKSRAIWWDLKFKRSRGVLSEDLVTGITEIARPVGVVTATTPCTNPVICPMGNAMLAIKCANSVIIAPHPRGRKVAQKLLDLWQPEFDKLGCPANMVQICLSTSNEMTAYLMSKGDVVVATGGPGMVKAAYSSGKPSYGVGPGNVPTIFDRDIDIKKAVSSVIEGRTLDNGVICASEQSLILPREQYEDILSEFVRQGCVRIQRPEDIEKVEKALFPNHVISREAVGQTAVKCMKLAGVEVPDQTKMVIVELDRAGKGHDLNKEKMMPVVCAYPYDSWEDALEMAKANLDLEGKGHTACIHSYNEEHIHQAGLVLKVSRVICNHPSSANTGGSFMNGLNPTTTIGCSTWGGNSISENLAYYHMMNKIRIARVKPGWNIPSDEEIWA